MSITFNETQAEAERTQEAEYREWKSIESEKERRHAIELRKLDATGAIKIKELELEAATARLKATIRSDVWKKLVVGIVKLPTLPFCVLFVFLLHVRDKKIPESLEKMLDI